MKNTAKILLMIIVGCLPFSGQTSGSEDNSDDLSDGAVQLKLLDVRRSEAHGLHQDSKGLALIAQNGFIARNLVFPAISSSADHFALLLEPSPHDPGVSLEIRNKSGFQVKNFEIFSEEDGYKSAYDGDLSVLPRVEEAVAEANAYLELHDFRPMASFFKKEVYGGQDLTGGGVDKNGWVYGDHPDDAYLEQGKYRLVFSQEKLSISMSDTHSNWSMDIPILWKTYRAHPSSSPGNDCQVQVYPSEGWISEHAKAIIIRFDEISAKHCGDLENWMIYRFPK